MSVNKICTVQETSTVNEDNLFLSWNIFDDQPISGVIFSGKLHLSASRPQELKTKAHKN